MNKTKATVLFLIDTLEVGGAERSILEIASRLKHHRPVVCHIYPGNSLAGSYQSAGLEVVNLDVPPKYNFLLAIQRVNETIRELKPDLIVTTLFRADVVGRVAGKWLDIPVISSFVNDTYSDIRLSNMSRKQRFKHGLLRVLDRVTAKFCVSFISNSHSIKRQNCLALGVPLDRVQVIFRGRNVSHFRHDNRPRFQRPNKIRILNVARLEERKGQADLIGAMKMVVAIHPQAQLFIAGEGPYRTTLEKKIAAANMTAHIALLGTRHDIAEQLAEADVFASPSYFEGLPGSVVEAMLSGIPTVLSDIDVHKEMLLDTDAEIQTLFKLGDREDLAKKLIAVIEQPGKYLAASEVIRQRAIEKFSIENIVHQHEECYALFIRR